jgi:hypothetical protein
MTVSNSYFKEMDGRFLLNAKKLSKFSMNFKNPTPTPSQKLENKNLKLET